MTIQSLENVGIVVKDLKAMITFFTDLGLKLLGEGPAEGTWLDQVLGLEGVQIDAAILETPDGHGRLELTSYRAPEVLAGDAANPPNTLGIRRIAFAVDHVDTAVAGLRARGIELVGEVVEFEGMYRLCYVRGPEGIIVMLSERLG
jgi:catechol 2,3-dioxygenase-like lactoylglutathione lyase family enzyme